MVAISQRLTAQLQVTRTPLFDSKDKDDESNKGGYDNDGDDNGHDLNFDNGDEERVMRIMVLKRIEIEGVMMMMQIKLP